jgi:UDP-N-acetylglucosamine--N-acetylmuramyl-(pentapeptide) pyrophosphoryl-undecaprenol N-acetylglucosamine transferase
MTNAMGDRPILLAAGGTGGHIFPAEALAEELIARGHEVALVTDKRFSEYNAAHQQGVLGQIPIYFVSAGTLGGGLLKKLKGVCSIFVGVFQARKLMKKLNPQAVVGFGGYPSFPTMFAASSKGVPTVLHEQNSVLGKANRGLASRVRRIALTYENTQRVPKECVSKTAVVGNPVRGAVKALHNVPYGALEEDSALNLLILGGSQGATILSQVVPAAIQQLPDALRGRLRIDQQCRTEDLERVKAMYQELGVSANVSSFFTDVAGKMASAHLVISRAGASTAAEVSVAGRPSILVPLPSSADNHQHFNAQALEDVGGAWLMPQSGFTADALAARLESFLSLPGALVKAAAMSKRVGKPEAADTLTDLVLEVAGGLKGKRIAREASADLVNEAEPKAG